MDQSSIQSVSKQGEKAFKAGNFLEAANLFEQAAKLYTQNGDMLTAAEMANNRSVALLQAGNAKGALEAAQNTELVFAQAGDVKRQAIAIGNQAAALEALGRFEEALTRFWECSELLQGIGEKEYRAIVLKNISTLQIRTGRHLQAIASIDASLNHKKLTPREWLLKQLLKKPMDMLTSRNK